MSDAQRKAVTSHRRRRRHGGVVRVEVQVPAIDSAMLRELVAILRSQSDVAQVMRDQLRYILAKPRAASAFEIFGSDLPDACFQGVFERDRRGDSPRDVEL